MNALYQQALEGTLVSRSRSMTTTKLVFVNQLPIPIFVCWLGSDGRIIERHALKQTESHTFPSSADGYCYLCLTVDTGALIGAVEHGPSTPTSVLVNELMFCKPNEVGGRPKPTVDRPIPTDTQPVLVGAGIVQKATTELPEVAVTRQQFWKLSQDSYVLAPYEKRTVGFQETSGMQSTSSTTDTVSSTLGLGMGVGWGPVSASFSASLSSTSTTMQQVTLSEQTVRNESVVLENKDPSKPVMYLYWQLLDVVTVFVAGKPKAATVTALRPVLVEVFDPENLPPSPKLVVVELTSPSSAPVLPKKRSVPVKRRTRG